MADETPEQPQNDPGSKVKTGLGSLVQAESVMQLALAVPVGCFVGLLAGSWLDRHFHHHWMAMTGLFLGAAGGFIQIFTSLGRMNKRGDQ
jgi:ATP synthase protein I